MLDGESYAFVEDDGVVYMPAICGGVSADDAPLVEVRCAEVRGARGFESPCGEKIILGAGAPDGGVFFAVDIDFFIAFAKP